MGKILSFSTTPLDHGFSIDSLNTQYNRFSELSKEYSDDTKIWRYLDFSKYVSLLNDRSLFFTRLDKFYDKYEGDYFKDDWIEIFTSYDPNNILSQDIKDHLYKVNKMGNFASCWHVNENENYGMWKSYLNADEGVAIQTTIKSLKEALINDDYYIIGKVIYVDYEIERSAIAIKERFEKQNKRIEFIPAFFKNKYYEFENEIRIVKCFQLSLPNALEVNHELLFGYENTAKAYIKSEVNLDKLIENIYINPDSSSWFKDLVSGVSKVYDVNKPIFTSKLTR